MNFQTSKKTVNLSKEIWPMVRQYYAWAKEEQKAGKKVVWTVGLGPNELFHAFGFVPIFLEQYSIVMAGRHQVTIAPDHRRLLGLVPHARGKRSPVTCELKCGNA
ncbi:MAG: hypothetical protein HGA63_09250, partial [Syntrophobacteraceae bacterium]|nr:hypothetical protein [Syntrophobacteraceae bacterium]